MSTIIIENADKKNAALISQLAKALGLSVTTKRSKLSKRQSGVITNAELVQRIERSEHRKTNRKAFSPDELSEEFKKLAR